MRYSTDRVQLRYILYIQICFLSFFNREAIAVPIVLDKSAAAATARDAATDPGTGLCGSVIHYATQPAPISQISEAVNLLNKPIGDVNIIGRISQIFDNINFRNDYVGSEGDFRPPNFTDTLFPYSINGTPRGDGNNIAVRLRGYINTAGVTIGQPITFGLYCGDSCLLKISGQSVAFVEADIVQRWAQQVIFNDSGLYPVEIVYFQKINEANLEWSRALSAEPEGDQAAFNIQKFQILPANVLYSAISGRSPSCQECGAPGQSCPGGTYCADGLCQTCNLPDHCGSACEICPANARECSQEGRCTGPDSDKDGIPDASDNCPSVSNSDQKDTDRFLCPNAKDEGQSCPDGIGDACDNCIRVWNPSQFDLDSNGIGDECMPAGTGGCRPATLSGTRPVVSLAPGLAIVLAVCGLFLLRRRKKPL